MKWRYSKWNLFKWSKYLCLSIDV